MANSDMRTRDLMADAKPQFEMTNHEIGRLLGISHGRVYQLGLRAVAKIRSAILADPVLHEVIEETCNLNLDGEPFDVGLGCTSVVCRSLGDMQAVSAAFARQHWDGATANAIAIAMRHLVIGGESATAAAGMVHKATKAEVASWVVHKPPSATPPRAKHRGRKWQRQRCARGMLKS